MKYLLHITRRAERDIESTLDYIEFNLFNPSAADKLLTKIEMKLEGLIESPELYPIVDDAVLKNWGIRFIPIDNYLAFYVIDKNDMTVYIIRFLYNKRNWIKILREVSTEID